MTEITRHREQLPLLPDEAKKKLSITKAAIQYATEMRDWEKLHVAIDEMIDIQKQFVGWWRETVSVRHGGDRSKSAERGTCSLSEAEGLTGITNQQVSRWRERLNDEGRYRQDLFDHELRKAMAQRGQADLRGASGTGENEWFTPGEFIELARTCLGEIDLDPASSDAANKVVGAKTYFTKAIDGLNQEWHGSVWLNPPYAQPTIAEFIHKLCVEWRAGRVTCAVALTHNYTDTAWFHELAANANAICFTRGRVKFYEGDKIAAPTQGQAFSYFGDDAAIFNQFFAPVGFVVCPWRQQ